MPLEPPPLVPAPLSIYDLARRAAAINASNGFDATTAENIIGKLGLVITEVNELVEAMEADADRDGHQVAEECADIAIRLLSILADSWPDWCSRISTRMPRWGVGPYEAPERMVWPIVREVCKAMEGWRRGLSKHVQQHTELALLETFRVGDRLCVDLESAIAAKLEKNATRGRCHGRARSLG
jgi:hypothetical protein